MSKLELQELTERVKALTLEDKKIVASLLPSEIMFDELQARDVKKTDLLAQVLKIIEQ